MAIHSNCDVIGVIGGKGGVGKSVFATNFACALLSEMRAPTLLIDADKNSCGDQNVLTGLRPIMTLSDLARFDGSINQGTLPKVVTKHASGLQYIGAVSGPNEKLNVSSEIIRRQIESLSKLFRFIVIDLGNEVDDLQMELIQSSTALMLITAPEVLVVNQTQRLVGDLLAATLPLAMFQLVINKASNNGLSPQAISQSLKLPVAGMIPLDELTTLSSIQRSTPFVLSSPQSQITGAYHSLVRKLTGGTLQKLKALSKPQPGTKKVSEAAPESSDGSYASLAKSKMNDPRTRLKIKVHNELIKAMDLKKGITDTQGDPDKERALREKTQQSITQIVDRESSGLARDERSRIIKEVLDEALGLGPLEDLLADNRVTEIMVNGAYKIFAERDGRLALTQVAFTSNLHLRNVIERIVTPLGRRIDEKTPYVDARLADGSRVNAVIEPLSIDGPALTIRKFRKEGFTLDDYVRYNSMTKGIMDFLKICVENGLNVVISGGTGSGKTTLLNCLSRFIPTTERIITVEDAAELQLSQEHVVRLETRPANMEGSGEVTIRDLIKNALRMRPDRIVVGECRDGAALDMLQAMNTGHDGSMTTTHANSPRECIARLETLCLMAGMDLPVRAIREQIAGAVHLIVQISRLSDGSRKVISVTEVVGMQGDTVTLQEVFRFKETGFDKNRKIQGEFQAMGLIPSFIEKLEQKGVVIPRDIFTNEGNKNAKPSNGPQNTKIAPPGMARPQATAGPKPMPRPMNRTGVKKASGGN